jgi:hypothetical protein
MVAAGTMPVLFLGPAGLGLSAGSLRFNLARSLGSLVMRSATFVDTLWDMNIDADDKDNVDDDESAFTNAFAVYLLAPRTAMDQILDQPQSSPESSWIFSNTFIAARMFGLSAGAALAHVINGIDRFPRPRKELLDELRKEPQWTDLKKDINSASDVRWTSDKQAVSTRAGSTDPSPTGALKRPQSSLFEDGLTKAMEDHLLNDDVIADLATS